jgi:hypothetical protein
MHQIFVDIPPDLQNSTHSWRMECRATSPWSLKATSMIPEKIGCDYLSLRRGVRSGDSASFAKIYTDIITNGRNERK